MAEDLTGFSPLDSLGPEFGGINRPNLNEISMSPFEGERITEPKINFPSANLIPVPNLTNPNINVRKQIVTRPKNQKPDFKNQKQATIDYLKAINQANQSKNQYAKIYSYDAGPDGGAFYKRYMAYGQETFDKIGFSPLRDNEANFNEYTSNWQGAKAMLTQSFLPMVAKGFISGPRDMMKMLSGDFSGTNLEDAREYEELAAIGYSSKGGFTGFMNNSAMNFGYSAGIMLEAIAEELAFLGLEAATVGGATPVVAAGTANNVSKVFRAAKGLNFATDFGKTIKNSLKGLSNFGDAKKFWQGVRSSENLSKVGNFLNPAENLFSAVQDMRKLSATDNLTSLAAISKTAGAFYRDVRSINMATSEARLEAGMVENKVYDKLYNQHYAQFGEPPSNDEQKRIERKSKEASVDTFYKNAGLIYLSNKLTFGNVTSPRGGIRNFIKTTKDDIVSIGGGKFGNVGKIVYNNAKKQFAFEANTVKNLAKSWYTDFGFKTAAKTVGFLKGNIAEGLQENAQEIISRANERYYTESYRSPLIKSHNFTNGATNYAAKSKSDYYLEEVDNEFSMQGLETFASGFMMGMYSAPLNGAIPFLSKNYNRIFKPEKYQEYVDNKTKIAEGLVKSLNDVNIGEFLNSRFLNVGSQDIINEIRQSGTKKEAIDAELESLVNASDMMLQTNTTDVFIEKLQSLKQMDDKDFAGTIGVNETDDLNKYRQRIDTTISKLNKIQDRYKYYNEKYPNPVTSDMLEDMDEKSDKYKDLVSLQNAWRVSVKNAVFFNEAFEDSITRMTQISDKITSVSGLKKVSAKDFQNILRPETILGELDLLKNEIDSLSGIENKSEQDKVQIRQKKEKYKELENFVKAYSKFNSFFNREEYTNQIKATLEEDLGREVTDEEVAKAYDEAIGSTENADARDEVINELKAAFNGYLKSAASQNDEIAFNENLDRAFELLMDHYKLGQESKKMAMYANVLHDPGNFFDLVQRNKQWMRDLYERRTEYYEEIAKQEMDGIEDNALLNTLAGRGIYLSLDEFSKWKYDGTPPTEFFDNVNKRVIPQQTDEYNEIYELFQRAAALKEEDIDITNEIVSDQLKLDLERLEKEKNDRLEALQEMPIKVGSKQIKKPRFKSMSYNYLADNMDNESYADIVIKNKDGEEEKVTVFKDADGNLRLNDKDGDLIDLKDKAKIKKAEQYKIEVKKDPRAVKQIEREFTIRRNDLIRSSRVKSKERFYTKNEDLPTTDTDISKMDEVLYNTLYDAYSEIVFLDPKANKELIDNEDKFIKGLKVFVKKHPKAKEIIDAYNAPYQSTEKLVDERAELIRPKTLEEVESALEVLYTKNLVVNPENENTYIEVDEQGIRIPGTPTHARISTLKGEYEATAKAPANRGTIIDDMLRDFVEGTITSVDDMNKVYENHRLRNATEDFSQDFINDLFNIFTEVKAAVDKKGIKLISRIPTLWGVINSKRYAGTIDLMGIDERGNVYVIDLKTSTQNRRDEEGDYYTNFKEGDTIQQSGYAEMIRQRTGITVKNVVIFPVQTTVVRELNQYVKAEANKDEKGKFTMQVEVDRNIFPESPEQTVAKKTFAPAAETDLITDEIYNNFVDNNEVPEEILNSIANKVINRTELSQREVSIFNSKTSEINEIIRKQSATTADTQAEIEAQKADIERRRQDALTELGQKQLTKGFNSLSEATKPEQVANAIVNIEQNKNQGALLSKEQEQQLSEAKAKLKEQGYEIVDYNIVRYGETTLVETVDFYDNEKDVLTQEQADAIESKINNLEKRGEEVTVDDLPSPVSRTIKPLIKKDGVMVQAAKVSTLIFESVEQAREAIKKSREAGNKKPNAADKINAKYDAELAALEQSTTPTTDIQFYQTSTGQIRVPSGKDGSRMVDVTYSDFNNIISQLSSSQIEKFKEYLREEIGKTSEKLEKESKIKSYQGSNATRNAILKTEKELKDTLEAVEQLTAGAKASPNVERRKQLGDKIIDTVWDRLAKEGITNADDLIGTRATIDNKDFNKFWSNVTIEDLQNYKASLEAQRDSALAKTDESAEVVFNPETGEFANIASVSEIEDQYNPTIEALNAEINFMENKTPERVSEFSQGDRLIAKNDVFYKDKAGNNSIFAESQSTIVVTKVDEKTGKVTVTPLGNSNSMEYTLKDMNSNFEKESTVIQKTQEPQEEIVITDDDKQIIKESTDSIDTFLGEFAAQAEIEKSVDDPKVTLEKLDKDLLDDLKC